MKCRHNESELRHRCMEYSGSRMNCMSWRTCCGCGSWLSLGPANDEPEAVRIEIRAAEIAAAVHGMPTRQDQSRWVWAECDGAEIAGWIERACDSAKLPEQPGEHAGYLARCIVEGV